MKAKLELWRVTKRYGAMTAVDDVSLSLGDGELVTLLGPSGSGKTTAMMMVAGFVEPDEGEILLDGKSLLDVPPHRRDIGVVFQNYALFPHMSVLANVEFPLRERGVARAEARRRAGDMLGLVGLEGFEDRRISQLSGGQQQRVALARALVFNPPLLIMDEPLSALDKRLREQMQAEIRRIQKMIGVSVLCVTHDQTEAFVLSDRIAIMNEGRILQVGAPREIYARPVNEFVARFLGESNILSGTVSIDGGGTFLDVHPGVRIKLGASGTPDGVGRSSVLIRPERITLGLGEAPLAGDPAGTTLSGTVRSSSFVGDTTFYEVDVGAARFAVRVPNASSAEAAMGDAVHLSIPAAACVQIPE